MGPEPPGRSPRRVRLPRRAQPSRRRSSEWPFLAVAGGVGAGLVVVAAHHFQSGSVIIAAALLAGAVLRLVLSEREAGMLAVRGRGWDAFTLGSLGVLIAIAALIVPAS